jgi:hypothetical protein
MADTLWDTWHDDIYCKAIDKVVGTFDYVSGKTEKIKEKSGFNTAKTIFKTACSYLSCSHGCWYGWQPAEEAQELFNTVIDDAQNIIIDPIESILDKRVCLGKTAEAKESDRCADENVNPEYEGTIPLTDSDNGVCLPSLRDMGVPTISAGRLKPENSILMAAACGCIPEVIKGLAKVRQIECTYVGCMSEAAVTGAPMTICEDDKDVAMCKHIWGPVIDLIPNPFKWLKDLGERIKTVIEESPVMALNMLVAGVCDVYGELIAESGVGGIGREEVCSAGSLSTDLLIPPGKGWAVALCGAQEAYYKIEDLKSMFPNFPSLTKDDWGQFLRVGEWGWDDDADNVCKGQAVQDLMAKISE